MLTYCRRSLTLSAAAGVLYEELKVDLTGMDRYLPSSVTGLKEVVFQEVTLVPHSFCDCYSKANKVDKV